MIVNAKSATSALTADGTNQGVVTVADTAAFYAGAMAYLSATGLATLEVTITSIVDTTKMTVRRTDVKLNYGNTNVSAYKVADGASITQPPQTLAGNDENYLKFVGFWSGLV